MSNAQQAHSIGGQSEDSLDDAEKGMYDSTLELVAPAPFVYAGQGRSTHLHPLPSPVSPVHEGITPCTSVPELVLPKSRKNEISHIEVYRRFFTFVVVFNLIGIILAATGRFKYAENHLGALVLGNLLMAILMRNELFVRFLYLLAIYGLRSVSSPTLLCWAMTDFRQQWAPIRVKLAVNSVLQHVGGIHSGCALSGAA